MAGLDPRQNLLDFQRMYDNDVKFSVAPTGACGVSHSRALLGSYDRGATLAGSLGKIGELEILNKIGGEKVGAGLRALASLSDSIRINGRGTADTLVGQGVNAVYDAVGLNSNQLNFAKNFNPQVVNRAQGQIEQIYNSVKQGKFSFESIPQIFADVQNAERLIRGIFTDNSGNPFGASYGQAHCGASPYAMDLIHYAPKYKFLFIVQFEYSQSFAGTSSYINHAFVVKSTTRPSVDFEYEDLNMYNFRTKVAKRAVYQPINMRFYDDDRNNALQFYTTYLKAMSPIANLNPDGPNAATEGYENVLLPVAPKQKQINSALGYRVRADASSIGTPGSTGIEKNFLRKVTIFHVYRQGRLMNIYNLYNPRITSLKLDDLDMSSSDGAEVEIEINFDGMFVVPGYQVQPGGGDRYSFQNINAGGLYPLGAAATNSSWNSNELDGLGLASGQSVLNLSATGATYSKSLANVSGSVKSGGSGGILDGLTGLISGITGAIGGVLGGITNAIGGVIGGVTGAIGGAIGAVTGVVGSVIGGVSNAINLGTSMIGSAVGSITGSIGSAVGAVTGMVGNAVGSVVNPLMTGISSGIAGITQPIGSIVGQATGAFNTGMSMMGSLPGQALGSLGQVSSMATGMMSSATGMMSGVTGNLTGAFTNAFPNYSSAISNAFTSSSFTGTQILGNSGGWSGTYLGGQPSTEADVFASPTGGSSGWSIIPTYSGPSTMPSVANNYGYQSGYTPTAAEIQMRQSGYSIFGIGV